MRINPNRIMIRVAYPKTEFLFKLIIVVIKFVSYFLKKTVTTLEQVLQIYFS